MRILTTMLALPLGTVLLCVPPAHADTVVGGAKLAGHGYVWDHASEAPHPPRVQASSYVIADLETGRILAAKDPHGRYRPASTLKTLTAITLIPRLPATTKVKPSRDAVDASGSAVGLDTRWKYTVRDLFHGLLMQSGNDAAIALAEANGGLTPTIGQMNAEARRIQALDTTARTTNGLDDDPPLTLAQQHSSAYDLALIMKQGLALPDFRAYVGRTLYDWPAPPTKKQRAKGKKSGGWQIGTHDHLLLGDRYRGMVGGKNGWTSHALGSFVGAASRNGHTIIIALMHAQSDFWGDARSLLNWGFAQRATVASVGALVDPIPPPRPTPTTMAAPGRPQVAGRASSGGGRSWWLVGGAGIAAVAVLGTVVTLVARARRRRRSVVDDEPRALPPASDGERLALGAGHVRTIEPATGRAAPPDALPDGDEPAPRLRPRGDVKVAGTPLSPVVDPPSSSRRTVPDPVRPAAEPDGESVPDDDGAAQH